MDALCLNTGVHAIASTISVGGAIDVRTGAPPLAAVSRSVADKSASTGNTQNASYRFSFPYPLKSFWLGRRGTDKRYSGIAPDNAVLIDKGEVRKGFVEDREIVDNGSTQERNGNWVMKILYLRSLWKDEEQRKNGLEESEGEKGINGAVDGDKIDCNATYDRDDSDEVCDECRVDDDEEKEFQFDRDSFSNMLRKVSLSEAKLYAQMSNLGNLAYAIKKIKPANLLKYHLRFVTSSIEKKEMGKKVEKDPIENKNEEGSLPEVEPEVKEQNKNVYGINASTAYQIAASAASYLHSHTKSILPFRSWKTEDLCELECESDDDIAKMKSDVADLMATTDSVTAVVAAKEEVKQAVADDLKSTHSSPCEWFICDDDQSGTRFFVIQGSESLASWKANLLFEPIQFEDLDVLVHRGIYEAAKGIYEQMLPEVRAHLKSHGNRATFRFTGHSLGGSLSLLVNLMLLIRGEVQASALLPVITFGSPNIMCGGDRLLRKLGLLRSHVQAIMMHRDIVPRAFSCSYPNHVAEFLKAINGNFRNHPCLSNQKLLFAPMGELLILQPEEKISPQHQLLPSGSGLYFLSCPLSGSKNSEKDLRAAQMTFLNSPHPLEILSDRSAYGSGGSIQRDHDMNSYLKSVRSVVRQELQRIRKAKREHRRKIWWPLFTPNGINAGIIMGRPVSILTAGQEKFNFSGVLQSGRESLKRFSRLVMSQHLHLLVLLLVPARLLLLGTYSVISFH